MIYALAIFILAAVADLWSTRLAESRGALENNKLMRRADGRMSLPKALAIKGIFMGLAAYCGILDPLLGIFFLSALAASQGIVAFMNWRIYRR
jgi:hypothetical protein